MEENIKIVFSLKEVNEVLNRLADIPAKYSMDLITFIRAKAQEQVNEFNIKEQTTVSEEPQPQPIPDEPYPYEPHQYEPYPFESSK